MHKFREIIPQGTKIDFMGHAKYVVPFTVTLAIISLVWMFTKGFNWGIDFAGGLECASSSRRGAEREDRRRAQGDGRIA